MGIVRGRLPSDPMAVKGRTEVVGTDVDLHRAPPLVRSGIDGRAQTRRGHCRQNTADVAVPGVVEVSFIPREVEVIVAPDR